MKPRLLLDCDGVLCDLLTPSLACISTMLDPKDLKDENLFKLAADYLASDLLVDLWSKQGFVENLQPYPGAVEAVNKLRDLYEVVVVTKPYYRSQYWVTERLAWLAKHFGFTENDVVFTADKSVVVGDLFVDDSAQHINRHNDLGRAVLFDQPYNRNSGHTERVFGFDGLMTKALEVYDDWTGVLR